MSILTTPGRHRAARPSGLARALRAGTAVAVSGLAAASAAPASANSAGLEGGGSTHTHQTHTHQRAAVVTQTPAAQAATTQDTGQAPQARTSQRQAGEAGTRTTAPAVSERSRESSASRSTARTAVSSSSGSAVVGYAQQYTGIMYRYGGSTPAGFDCSGYTQFVFAQAGISIPRTTEAQRLASTPVSSPRPGDLVFWGAPAYHVAIYAGDGMIFDSGRPGLPSQERAMFSGATSFGRVA